MRRKNYIGAKIITINYKFKRTEIVYISTFNYVLDL